jgi:hypothetical protein
MGFALDVASKTVIITEASDVDLIDESVRAMGKPVRYDQLARTWAVVIGKNFDIPLKDSDVMEGSWAFGSTDPEVSKLVQARMSGSHTEIKEMRTS